MAQLHPPRPARTHHRAGGGTGGHGRCLAIGSRGLGHQHGFLENIPGGVNPAHRKFLAWIPVLDHRHTQFELVSQFVLRVDPGDPERCAALIELVGDADRDRIEIGVNAQYRRLEQQPSGEGLDLVVGEAALGFGIQDQARLVAVTREDFDLFAVDHRTRGQVEQERAGSAVGGEFIDHLAEGIAADETVDRVGRALEMPFCAGERAAELRQRARARRAGGGEIAVQQKRAPLVDPHIETLGALAVEAARRGVAVDRIKLVRTDVAEHPLLQVFVGVIGQRQQVFTLDLAFEKQRGARSGRELAAARFVMKALNLLFKAVAILRRHQILQRQAVEIDRPLDDAGPDQRPQVRQEGDFPAGAQHSAGHVNVGVARIGRRRQLVAAFAAVDEHLGTCLLRIEVGHQPAAQCRLQGDRGTRGDRRAFVIDQAHLDGDRRDAVGGR